MSLSRSAAAPATDARDTARDTGGSHQALLPTGAIQPHAVPPLYAIADGDALGLQQLSEGRGVAVVEEAVAAMADAGVGWIQLRIKRATDRLRYRIAEACARRLEGSPSVLWIDDRVDLAALVAARGVHLGQQDLTPAAARRVLAATVDAEPSRRARTWIGLSCHDLAQVEAAEFDKEVDVVAVGPVFPTRSKAHPDPVIGLEGVAAARAATGKPLVAIGGIDESRMHEVLAAGADSIVMLGAFCRGDVAANSRRLVAAVGAGPGGSVKHQTENRPSENPSPDNSSSENSSPENSIPEQASPENHVEMAR